MILVVRGIDSYTPIKEILENTYQPYHVCDIIIKEPHKGYPINKEIVKNSVSFYKPRIIFGKSYGSWIVAESIDENIPIFLFSMPIKDGDKIFGFPNIKNVKTNLIYSLEDPYFDKEIIDKNKDKYSKVLFLSGDHSLRPVNLDKISKIKKFILDSCGTKNFNSFSEDYLNKKKNARVSIVKKTNFYEEVPFNKIRSKVDESLKFALNKNYGPVTNIVKRKSPVENLFVYQSNILDTSKVNPLVKNSAATGGIGVSYDEKIAINKSIFEALERYSLTLSIVDFVVKKYDEIPHFLRVDKKELVFHTKSQMKTHNLRDALKEKIHWTVIRDAFDNKEKLYPVQLIIPNDLGYMIRETSSSGTALGKTKEQALTHGLREAIERNSLMMWFYGLSEVKSKKIELNKRKMPKKLLKIYNDISKKGFKFKTYLIDFHGFNTVFTLAFNENELYIGSSCGGYNEAISGALEEIIITSFFAKTLRGIIPKKPEEIKNLPQHFLYYQGKLKFQLLNYLDSISKDKVRIDRSKFDYVKASKLLQKKGYNVYYKDITAPELRGRFFVIKVIIPGFLDVIKNNSLSWDGYYKIKKKPNLPTPFA
ncbi:MAG: hypothetical protein KatS3mg001_510 [Candidatus Pacearchaeota archaeon]|nr:MAG: hypothetical protein KatS3mg001_510 [Candidatus Pacearchaeota archaeon]